MSNNHIIKRVVLIATLIAISTTWFFWPTTPAQQTPKKSVATATTKTKHQAIKPEAPRKNMVTPIVKPAKITSKASAILIAKAYKEVLNYPPYSQPLTNNDLDRLKPNHFNPQSIPVDDNGTTITAKLSKYRYTYPEPVLVTLNGENIAHAKLLVKIY